MDFTNIFSNPGIQKYLFDLSAGMSKGLAEQPSNLNAAIGTGLGNAAQGQSAALGQQIEAQRQMDLAEQERLKQQAIMKQIMGDRSSLTDSSGQPTQGVGGIDFNDPASMMKMGFALSSSGSPQLMGFGEKLMGIASTMDRSQIAQNQKIWNQDIGGFNDKQGNWYTPEGIPARLVGRQLVPISGATMAPSAPTEQVAATPETVSAPVTSAVQPASTPVVTTGGKQNFFTLGQPTTPSTTPSVTTPSIEAPALGVSFTPSPVPTYNDPRYQGMSASAIEKDRSSIMESNRKGAEEAAKQTQANQAAWNKEIAAKQADIAMTAPKEQAQVIGKAQGESDVANKKVIENYKLFNAQIPDIMSAIDKSSESPLGAYAAETGSGLARSVKTATGYEFGRGAEESKQANVYLKGKGAALVSQVERMGGNTSDADLKFLQAQGGVIDDPTASAEQKKNAVTEVQTFARRKLESRNVDTSNLPAVPKTSNINPKIDKSQLGKVVEKGGKKYKITATGYEEL